MQNRSGKAPGFFLIYRDGAGLINFSLGPDYDAIPPENLDRIAQLIFKIFGKQDRQKKGNQILKNMYTVNEIPKLTGELVIGYKIALEKIILKVTTELAPAITQDDPVTIATILDNVMPVITEVKIIIDTTSDSDVKNLGAEIIKQFEWYSDSFTIADLDLVSSFKGMLYVFFTKANTTFKKRIRFEIPVHQA